MLYGLVLSWNPCVKHPTKGKTVPISWLLVSCWLRCEPGGRGAAGVISSEPRSEGQLSRSLSHPDSSSAARGGAGTARGSPWASPSSPWASPSSPWPAGASRRAPAAAPRLPTLLQEPGTSDLQNLPSAATASIWCAPAASTELPFKIKICLRTAILLTKQDSMLHKHSKLLLDVFPIKFSVNYHISMKIYKSGFAYKICQVVASSKICFKSQSHYF